MIVDLLPMTCVKDQPLKIFIKLTLKSNPRNVVGPPRKKRSLIRGDRSASRPKLLTPPIIFLKCINLTLYFEFYLIDDKTREKRVVNREALPDRMQYVSEKYFPV